MYRISRERFEQVVDEGIGGIPEKFLAKLDNLVIVIEDEPTSAQRRELELRSGWTLFGLYEGVPQAERGDHYTNVLPDKITIFQKPIEEEAESLEDIREIVKETVWHEIAHHFGLDEDEVEEAGKRRRKRGE
ncbi:MAG: hypothetical protein UY41_C0001G0017 [Candidatus Moranbacteria bacterium GW2011_GWE1_49_15]|nr:MAG: hypothetical protein UX75_C0006G0006 [Candidatus Moranbacteria bacterium GW2011_GWE2_47_10]KKW07589.1 MAG: hypothetical protein UY41_C0001G0017 [Candidatus Moranbacteria bacterium GW2011_GWE1_49_15]HBP01079.1 hypothetical protein [Candidatus Moranbacteria bacterium]